MNEENFIKTINNLRIENKNKWYFWEGIVNNKNVQIKGFKTWLQIFKIDGISINCPMDISVKAFKDILNKINNI